MPRSTLVRSVMTTDVLTLRPDDTVEAAARALAERRIGGAPVVDGEGMVVGLLEDDDLIVRDAKLHFPTVISVLGAYIELPSSVDRFHQELRKAVGATVADVMDRSPRTCGEDDTLEQVATAMHDDNLSRLPVVRDGKLVGIVSRGDMVRALLAVEDGEGSPAGRGPRQGEAEGSPAGRGPRQGEAERSPAGRGPRQGEAEGPGGA